MHVCFFAQQSGVPICLFFNYWEADFSHGDAKHRICRGNRLVGPFVYPSYFDDDEEEFEDDEDNEEDDRDDRD